MQFETNIFAANVS